MGVPTLTGRPAVFLDRDGLLIERRAGDSGVPLAVRSVAEMVLTAGALEACELLRRAGYVLVLVTNQPDVARGMVARPDAETVNAAVRARLGLDDVRACFHDDADACACRKPRPGLLLDAAHDLGLDLPRSFMVGDRWRDVGAGRRAGCRTVLVDEVAEDRRLEPDHRCASVLAAARWILEQSTAGSSGKEGAAIDLATLRVKIFADGADLEGLRAAAADPRISGFTTNPTLMRKAGIADYEAFAREALRVVGDRPISFEVFADGFDEMRDQALEIASWGRSVYVKIPITNTAGRSSRDLLLDLAREGVAVNVTAILTLDQVAAATSALAAAPRGIISVFAGRYADTGRDPIPMMRAGAELVHAHAGLELLWASPREILNIVHAEQAGCDIITVSNDLLAKLPLFGKDLAEHSLDTVRMFHDDAVRAGYRIRVRERTRGR